MVGKKTSFSASCGCYHENIPFSKIPKPRALTIQAEIPTEHPATTLLLQGHITIHRDATGHMPVRPRLYERGCPG